MSIEAKRKLFELMNKEELINELLKFYSNPNIGIYLSIETQLNNLSKLIKSHTFSINGKDFENFLKWAEKSPVIANSLSELRKLLDPAELVKERDKKAEAKPATVEHYLRKS